MARRGSSSILPNGPGDEQYAVLQPLSPKSLGVISTLLSDTLEIQGESAPSPGQDHPQAEEAGSSSGATKSASLSADKAGSEGSVSRPDPPPTERCRNN